MSEENRPASPTRVLMIEDDTRLAEMVGEYLSESGLEFESRPDATSGLRALQEASYDALLLDVMLPDLDGFEICRRIRQSSSIPIIMLSARGEETDRVVGLEIGADDYLPKPFSPRELLARLRAVLRRTHSGADAARAEPLRFGALEIDRAARSVRLSGEERTLTAYQFDLLCVLAESAGRVLSRDQIMQQLKGRNLDAFDRSIDTHVSRIRAAIELDPKKPQRLLTVRGAGYVFARDTASEDQ